jgi:hypothetical protein
LYSIVVVVINLVREKEIEELEGMFKSILSLPQYLIIAILG